MPRTPAPRSPAERKKTAAPVAAPVRRGLDRRQVLDAARLIADRTGLAGLTIRELAQNLQIRPPSVYAHFGGLPELRRELALWGLREITQLTAMAAVGLAGRDALLAQCHAYLAFIRTSPGLYEAVVPTPDVSDVEWRSGADAWMAAFYRVLDGMDLRGEAAVHALRGVRSIVHGFGMLERHGAFRTRLDRDASFKDVLETYVDAILRRGSQGKGEDADILGEVLVPPGGQSAARGLRTDPPRPG